MTPTEKFLKAPMSFLEKNIVLTPFELAQAARAGSASAPSPGFGTAADGVYHLGFARLDSLPGTVVRGLRNGAPCPVYQMQRKQPGDADSFSAYLCPFRGSNAASLVINNKANFLFAINFQGCNVDVGHKTGHGARRIGYRSALAKRSLTSNATVFGRISSVSGDWVFYAQNYRCSASGALRTYAHEGLGKLLEAVV